MCTVYMGEVGAKVSGDGSELKIQKDLEGNVKGQTEFNVPGKKGKGKRKSRIIPHPYMRGYWGEKAFAE